MLFYRHEFVISALLGVTLFACGEQDLLSRVETDLPRPEAVEIQTDTGHEGLTASVALSAEISLDVQILNQEQEQIIRISHGARSLFEQRLSHEGVIKELRMSEVLVSTQPDNSVDLGKTTPLEQYLRDCHERRILCYLDVVNVLASVQLANPDAFARANAENALIGLEAFGAATDESLPPESQITPRILASISLPYIDFDLKK
jgi:hypothetical protein